MLSVVIPARDPVAVARTVPARFGWADEVVVQGGPGGVALARNNGARKARGDLLVFTDDDTELEWSEWPWEPRAADGFWVASEFEAECEDPHTQAACTGLSFLVATPLRRMRWLASVGPFMACRRSVFDALGGYRRAPQEDTDFGNRASNLRVPIGLAPVRVHVRREFRLKHLGMAVENYVAEADLPVQDGPAIVLHPASSRLKNPHASL